MTSFAASARILAGVAGRMLGWPPDWFWRATPAELAAILFPETGSSDPGISRAALHAMMERDSNG